MWESTLYGDFGKEKESFKVRVSSSCRRDWICICRNLSIVDLISIADLKKKNVLMLSRDGPFSNAKQRILKDECDIGHFQCKITFLDFKYLLH